MKKVADIMNNFPILVDEETCLSDVFRIFQEKLITHLLVVSGIRLTGIVSKEDLLFKMLQLARDTTGVNYNRIILATTPVTDIMSTDLTTVTPGEDLRNAVQIMLEARVHCLPVINENHEPVGELLPTDLLEAFAAGIHHLV